MTELQVLESSTIETQRADEFCVAIPCDLVTHNLATSSLTKIERAVLRDEMKRTAAELRRRLKLTDAERTRSRMQSSRKWQQFRFWDFRPPDYRPEPARPRERTCLVMRRR
jgi:hypothetical protein